MHGLRTTIFITFFSALLIAQDPTVKFEHISAEQGLASNAVEAIFQDSRGFIWFGTRDGLSRYDGRTIINYKHSDNDSNSISNNYIKSIVEDDQRRLWIATLNGLNSLDLKSETFKYYPGLPGYSDGSPVEELIALHIDHNNRLWIGTMRRGIKYLDLKTFEFDAFDLYPPDSSALGKSNIISFMEDSDGYLWVGTTLGIFSISPSRDDLIRCDLADSIVPDARANRVRGMTEGEQKTIWFGTLGGGLVQYSKANGVVARYVNHPDDPHSLVHDVVMSVVQSQAQLREKSMLWIGTVAGLSRFDTSSRQFTNYLSDPLDPYSLRTNYVPDGYVDNSGTLWVSSHSDGVAKHSPLLNRFLHITNIDQSLTNDDLNDVFAFCEQKSTGIIWIGTGGGLAAYDPANNRWANYVHDKNDPESVSAGLVLTLQETSDGEVYLGTRGGGLNKLQMDASARNPLDRVRFQRLVINPDADSRRLSDRIFGILEGNDKTLWIATATNGLNHYDPATKSFRAYQPDPDDSSSISHRLVESLLLDQANHLWVGTFQGLNRLDRNAGMFTVYLHDPENQNSLSSNNITTLLEDEHKNLWIGTRSGLNRLDSTRTQFARFSTHDGLSHNYVHGLVLDDDQNLWVSTAAGLSRISSVSADDINIQSFGVHEGLVKEGFNTGAYLKLSSGELLFGGPNGYNRFDPQSLGRNLHHPPIYITEFYRLGKASRFNISVSHLTQIELGPKDYFFSFEFAALDFWAPFKNRYQYQMTGVDPDWVDAGNRNDATYTNLDAGSYTFQVRGSNSDGVWSSEVASLNVIIYPPFWKTNFAYFIYSILFVGVLIALRGYDVKRQRLTHDLELERVMSQNLKDLHQLKSRFFANISHEFRTPLTLIKGPVEEMISDAPTPVWREKAGIISRNADRLLNLINQLLDLSKLESGSIKLERQEADIVAFVSVLVQSFESFASQRKINLTTTSSYDSLNMSFDAEKLQQVMFNLLSNAFKFTGEGGSISVAVEIPLNPPSKGEISLAADSRTKTQPVPPFERGPGGMLEITVSDSGIGIPADQLPHVFDRFYQVDASQAREHEGTGIGLALTKELVELHGGSISVDSVEGEGTAFCVQLPITTGGSSKSEGGSSKSEGGSSKSEQLDAGISALDSAPSSSGGIQPIILVVEDNTDVRNFICQTIKHDYKVLEAANGKEGVAAALEHIPDLIISDVMMPEMDGFELSATLKQDISTNHIPIVLLTARAEDTDKLEGLQTGADDYLIKPFNAAELKTRIHNLITVRRNIQDKFKRDFLTSPNPIEVTSAEDIFLLKVGDIIEKHMDDPSLSVEQVATEVAMSRYTLHRKILALTDLTPTLFIRSVRLKRAAQLMQQKSASITETCYDVGFTSPAYFSKCFKEQFGVTPKEYVKEHS